MNIISFLLISFYICTMQLTASEMRIVYGHDIVLGKNSHKGTLKLYESPDRDGTGIPDDPALIEINLPSKSGSDRLFYSDKADKDGDSAAWPIVLFPVKKFNSRTSRLTNLKNGVNNIDIDGDGAKELSIYGISSYGGSGFIGKIIIADKIGNSVKVSAVIKAADNFEIKLLSEYSLIIVAEYFWADGEAHYGDMHRYRFHIIDPADGYRRYPLYVSKNRFSDESGYIIDRNLKKIILR